MNRQLEKHCEWWLRNRYEEENEEERRYYEAMKGEYDEWMDSQADRIAEQPFSD